MDAKKKKLIFTLLGALILYLASSGLSFAAFRYLGGPVGSSLVSPVEIGDARSRVDLSAPKTEECPLNGGMFTKGERQIWEGRRPLAIMVENHEESRPQSGLSSADVVYEAVAEGGITRFMAVFYCGASAMDVTVGPVRSARTYYLDWASEYADYPLYAHVGGANKPGLADALGQIGKYGWLSMGNDLSAFSLSFPVYWRDPERLGREVATEHTMYSSTDKLWEVAQKRGSGPVDDQGHRWDDNFTAWKFKKETGEGDRGQVNDIKFNFWDGYEQYAVNWQYNQGANEYWRFNGGQSHHDLNNDQQLKAKVVVVQFTKEKGPIDELKHLLYTTIGIGKAIVFQDGQAIEGNWTKKDRQSRTKLTDSKGQEIEFNGGPIWIEIVPTGKKVTF